MLLRYCIAQKSRDRRVRYGFENPLGLAAGMDKKAEAMQGWETLGFGFIEVGGITEHEQTVIQNHACSVRLNTALLLTEWVSITLEVKRWHLTLRMLETKCSLILKRGQIKNYKS